MLVKQKPNFINPMHACKAHLNTLLFRMLNEKFFVEFIPRIISSERNESFTLIIGMNLIQARLQLALGHVARAFFYLDTFKF